MTRYKIIIEYDGTHFAGWQRQESALSVQEVVEEALYRLTGQRITIFCAGRTDAGVHAAGQVAHFDLDNDKIPDFTIANALNFHLRPYPASILDVARVTDDWHARFMATQKTYLYRIINRQARLALERNKALHVKKIISVDAMIEAKSALLGKHDFSSFRSAQCQAKNPIRSIDSCSISKHDDHIEIEFKAKSFLHNQVRIMVGCLVGIGLGKNHSIPDILAARDRKEAPETAPAHGLYLMKVEY